MDVNPEMHQSRRVEHNNAQPPHHPQLGLTTPIFVSFRTIRHFCVSTGGGKVSWRHSVCESVCVVGWWLAVGGWR